MATFLCVLLLSADFFNGLWWQFRLREVFKAGFMAIAAFFTGFPLVTYQALVATSAKDNNQGQGRRLLLGILKGLLITIPLILLFTFLFSYADVVFESKVDSLLKWFQNEFLSQLMGRILLTLFFTWLLSAGLWLAITFGGKPLNLEDDKALPKPFLGMTETSIALVSLNLLFAFFLIIQFQYLFAGEANIVIDGYTYAEYAERGFMELLLVAGVAALVYYGLAAVTKRESRGKSLSFSILGGLLLAQVGVVLLSASKRIGMYINAYGLTAYRLIPQIFIYFLAAILLALVVMEFSKTFKHMALVLFSAFLIFAVTLAVINVDSILVKHNIERALDGQELDYAFLNQQVSTDAEPFLFELLNSGNLPDDLQQNLEKVMVCRMARNHVGDSFSNLSPLNFDFSRGRADFLYQQNWELTKKWPLESLNYSMDTLGFRIGDQELFCVNGEFWD
jgi:hypothetical protein